ncbi:MAG: O-antigen ligase domain-containing protein [Planctomycetota bacterium]|nr:MAG: O-antigen ligase domain-containing protein [Planctomycetota bacterium]
MTFLVTVLALPLLVWGGIALVRGSIFVSVALFLVFASCFPSEFFAFDAGGMTWTLDRFWFLGLIGQYSVTWVRGKTVFKQLQFCDMALGLFLLWLIARAITQPWGSTLPGQPPTLMHLINGYLIPAALYGILRTSPLDPRQLRHACWILAGFGVYLAVTALLEILHLWPLVFPKFIADPTLGIHFGRARGPFLQSVRLGMCLVGIWVLLTVYTVWLKPTCRFRWVTFVGFTPLFLAAVFATYTRSIWLAAALSIGLLIWFGLRGLPRKAAILGIVSCAMFGLALKGPDLIAFKREYSAAETRESTYMRAAFAYVSIQMFKDRPLAGFGFNQFQVYNPPYLADRSTDIRLDSIRGYVHHNSYLSLLVDLGLIGVSLFLMAALSFARQAWVVWRARGIPRWVRGLALVSFSVAGTHVIQMAFHEVSFSPIENSLLFSCLGLVVAAKEQFCVRPNPTPQHRRPADSTLAIPAC